MKKQLLLGSALLAAVGAYSQTGRVRPKASGSINSIAARIAATFAVEPQNSKGTALKQPIGPVQNPNAREESTTVLPPSTINWKLLCGESNIYGALVSHSRPLQYNDNVNAVSFVHRRSATYNPTPALAAAALSGVITAEISSNMGLTFDSTCLYSDGTNWGRYPQGAIYNPVGNTAIANAYVVGSGPTVAGSNFSGDWYASKKLNVFNTTADATPNAQQFLSFGLTSYPANQGPHSWSRQGFTSTDDGVIRSLALIEDDNTGLTTMRGVAVVKGTFNAGVFTWTSDSLIPNTIIESAGTKVISPSPQMAWNEAGTVGYVVILGAQAGATNSNKGYQPIVYKTTNSGTSWAQVPGIDFNSAAMSGILDHIAALNTNTNVAVPFFEDEVFDLTVDANNKLHIGTLIATGASSHNDSLAYYAQYTLSVNQGEDYKWGHVAGNRPYVYDFVGDGTAAWNYKVIDSLASEGPSAQTGYPGFNDNPWDASGSGEPLKTDDISARIQLGRTPDGQYITYSWVESDTNFTNGGKKWNTLPNIHTRLYSLPLSQLATTELNVTKVAVGTGTANANVANRATLHYMSPTTGSATVSGLVVDVVTPLAITNSNPYAQLTNNTVWYQMGKLSYTFLVTSIENNTKNSASNSMIFPNPASNNAVLAIELQENSNVELTVLNTVGQVVKTTKAAGQIGQNNINIDLAGLSTGVYIVNVKVGNATSTKKLIVE